MSEWFAYAPGSAVPEYQAEGWSLVDTAQFAHHDAYSAILRWDGEGPPPGREPVEERLSAAHRLKVAFEECDAKREGDEAAFKEALTALGLCCWNLRSQIETALG